MSPEQAIVSYLIILSCLKWGLQWDNPKGFRNEIAFSESNTFNERGNQTHISRTLEVSPEYAASKKFLESFMLYNKHLCKICILFHMQYVYINIKMFIFALNLQVKFSSRKMCGNCFLVTMRLGFMYLGLRKIN